MRRGRTLLILLLILILGVVALFFGYQLLAKKPAATVKATVVVPTPTPVTTTKVVQLTDGVIRGEIIDPRKLGLVDMPNEFLLPDMVQDPNQVAGKVARFDMPKGTLLVTADFTDQLTASSQGSDAALMVPPGFVAVSIPIDRLTSVSYGPMRGDHVNVIVTMMFVDLDADFQTITPNKSGILAGPSIGTQGGQQPHISGEVTGVGGPQGRTELDPGLEFSFYWVPSEIQRPRMVAQTLIQDVIVLQMGDFPEQAPKVESTPVVTATQKATATPTQRLTPTAVVAPPRPTVITLIVKPQDAVTLNYLIYSGAKLTLALRGTGDTSTAQTEAVTLQFLMDQYRITVPAKLPYGLEPRVNNINEVVPTPIPTAAPPK